VGIFEGSIDSNSILIGGQSPTPMILSSTSSTVTVKCKVNSTSLATGVIEIRSSSTPVQNRWLYPMQSNSLIGSFVLSNPTQAPTTTPGSSPKSGKTVSSSSTIANSAWLLSLLFVFY